MLSSIRQADIDGSYSRFLEVAVKFFVVTRVTSNEVGYKGYGKEGCRGFDRDRDRQQSGRIELSRLRLCGVRRRR